MKYISNFLLANGLMSEQGPLRFTDNTKSVGIPILGSAPNTKRVEIPILGPAPNTGSVGIHILGPALNTKSV
jgi:hypothetical protein